MSNENVKMGLVEVPPSAVAERAAPVTPTDLLIHAMNSGADLDRLDRLMDLQMRYEADQARKAFADDMARFKAVPLTISKDKQVSFKTDKGRTEYMHATIGNVVSIVVPVLAEFGFAHRWDVEQRDGLVIVTCVITHRMGHSQSTTLMANPDSSGGKNAIQSVISAKSYLERHTLLAATGLATKDQVDDDGQLAEAREDMPKPGATQHKQSMNAAAFGKALAAIKTKQYTVAEIEQTYVMTPEQREQAVSAELSA